MKSIATIVRAALSGASCVAFAGLAAAGGDVIAQQKIGELEGGFVGSLNFQDRLGSSIVQLGDLNADGIEDVAVGMPGFDGANTNQGAVWVFLLNADGTIQDQNRISEGEGGFGGTLAAGDAFGSSLTALEDINNDGRADLIVGSPGSDIGGADRGAAWVLFLDASGVVQSEQTISSLSPGFAGSIDDGDALGSALANVGDLDGDGLADLGIGAVGDDDGAPNAGAVWFVRLSPSGTVQSTQKVSATAGGFSGELSTLDNFGSSIVSIGDLDGNGAGDFAVGAHLDDDGGSFSFLSNVGAVWILFMELSPPTTSVLSEVKLSSVSGVPGLDNQDRFGSSLANLVDGAGNAQLVVGSPGNPGGTASNPTGRLYFFELAADGTAISTQVVGPSEGGFTGTLADGDQFGIALGALPDIDGDGRIELAVGASGDSGTSAVVNAERGAVWTLFLDIVPNALLEPYGCDTNPEDSLVVLSGQPSLGTTISFGVDNPLGTQAALSLPALVVAFNPDVNFPCGTLIPGFGMSGFGENGELLISLAPFPSEGLIMFGAPWQGAGMPSQVDLAIPNESGFIGIDFFVQAVLIDPSPGAIEFGLTGAYRAIVGP